MLVCLIIFKIGLDNHLDDCISIAESTDILAGIPFLMPFEFSTVRRKFFLKKVENCEQRQRF